MCTSFFQSGVVYAKAFPNILITDIRTPFHVEDPMAMLRTVNEKIYMVVQLIT